MLGKSPIQNQRDLLRPMLVDFIDSTHELVLLHNKLDWKSFEQEFAPLYSNVGAPSMPIRFMVGCLILKHLYNLGDETLAKEWVMNPYMQFFCGEPCFLHKFPCDPSDFVHFRHRIGEDGFRFIFKQSVCIHGDSIKTDTVMSDTTVQGNNIEFPTDARLAGKIINRCNKISEKENITQRQNYRRKAKELLRQTHNAKHPKRVKKANAAKRKLKTVAGRLVRELDRKLPEEVRARYTEELGLMYRILQQERTTPNKIYSLHKPFTCCIAKGKAHKQYEFGNKVGLITTTGKEIIILAIDSFMGNPHDSKTIEPLLIQAKQNTGKQIKEIVYDRGGKGVNQIDETAVITPSKPKKSDKPYRKRVLRKKFRRRAAIEPIIGHLKKDHRMEENCYHGAKSPTMNALLAASAWNFKKMMQKLKREFLCLLIFVFQPPPQNFKKIRYSY